MKEYIGKYRVIAQFDLISGKPNKEDLSILCTGGGQIYAVGRSTMVYYNPTRRGSLPVKLDKLGVEYEDWLTSETEIRFSKKDLDLVAKVFGVMTKGAGIPPHSVRNRRFSK